MHSLFTVWIITHRVNKIHEYRHDLLNLSTCWLNKWNVYTFFMYNHLAYMSETMMFSNFYHHVLHYGETCSQHSFFSEKQNSCQISTEPTNISNITHICAKLINILYNNCSHYKVLVQSKSRWACSEFCFTLLFLPFIKQRQSSLCSNSFPLAMLSNKLSVSGELVVLHSD